MVELSNGLIINTAKICYIHNLENTYYKIYFTNKTDIYITEEDYNYLKDTCVGRKISDNAVSKA